jgi:hypothetical protein
MIATASGRRRTLSAFAAALIIGAAPAAYAECASGQESAAAAQTSSGEAQAEAATGQSGQTVGQSITQPSQPDSQIETDQGGTTVDQSGEATAQSGSTDQAETDATAKAGQGQAADSGAVSSADEERIKTMLEQQNYTDVSSIVSCGTYYEAEAMQDGKQVTVQVDLETGRISPPE